MPFRALELFAGSGVVSQRFREGGWDTTEVELTRGGDVMTFQPDGPYDFVWASPPCQQYSGFSQHARKTKYRGIWDADPTLWLRSLEIVRLVRPRFWVFENVKFAQWVWGRAPYHYGAFFLWGYFPKINCSVSWRTSLKGAHYTRSKTGDGGRQFADGRNAAERAIIPAPLVEAVYAAVTRAL